MTDSVDVLLGTLASVSDSLNKASDFLSMRISEVESALAGYKLGISAWVTLKREMDEEGQVSVRSLGYGKHQGKWGLLIADYDDMYPEDAEETFLRDAPRDVRLAAVDKFPQLLKNIVEKANEVATEATRKAETAREIAAGLAKKQPK